MFDFMTPQLWDGLVIAVVVIGLAFAILRLYSDLTRPIPPSEHDNDPSRR